MKTTFAMKMLALVVSLVMVLSLFACGEDTTTFPDATATNAPTEEKTEAPTEEKTEAPTSEKTEAPTSEKTEAPTDEQPTEAPGCAHEEVVLEGKAATCTEAGLTEGKKCAKCEEILVPQEEIPATGHTEETLAAVAPTCQATGLTEGKKCSVCDAILTVQEEVAIDPNAHNMDNGTPAEAAKCGDKATVTYKCQNEGCTHTNVVEGEVLAHDMDEGTVTTAPTCTDKGVKTFKCKREGCTHTTTEAIDALGHDMDEGSVTTAPTCTEAGVKTFTCKRNCGHKTTEEVAALGHTKGNPDPADKCNVKCTVCNITLEEGKHAAANIAAVWTAVIGKGEDGNLYEEKLCSACKTAVETRKVFYKSNLDGIYADGVIVNPKEGKTNQTEGCGQKLSEAIIYDGANNMIDKDGNALTVVNNIKLSGWFGTGGGVEKYVYKINDGAWTVIEGTPKSSAGGGIGTHLTNNHPDMYDPHKNANYQDKLTISGLQKYANQTITIYFAAVPASNPGEESSPNVLLIAVIENVFITCAHNDKKLVATDDLLKYNAVCNTCNKELGMLSDVNQEGLTMLTPEKIKDISSVTKAEVDMTVRSDSAFNNMPYLHIEATQASSGEAHINISEKITGVGKYVALVYRSSNFVANEMFISSTSSITGGMEKTTKPSWITDSKGWQFTIFDFSEKDNWSNDTGIAKIRWDIQKAVAAGNYLDVAYLGFFSTQEAAESFFASYQEKYDLDYLFKYRINTMKVNGEKVLGTTDNIGKTFTYDFTGVTLNSPNAIVVDSWFCAPNGTESYVCRVSDGENVTVESDWIETKDRTDLLNHMKSESYYTTAGFTEDCAINANLYEAFQLSKYAGKTITIEVVATTKEAKEVVMLRLANITVPAAN